MIKISSIKTKRYKKNLFSKLLKKKDENNSFVIATMKKLEKFSIMPFLKCFLNFKKLKITILPPLQ
jgi:hypothetical protein